MTHPSSSNYTINPELDLVLERVVDLSPQLMWKAWTQPELMKHWFCPRPWSLASCEIDLRPGGIFKTVMRSPEGQEFPGEGCYLELIENKKIVWTDAMTAGYRPADKPFITAIVTFEPHGQGTKYKAVALHKNLEDRQQHEQMGFHEGWSTCVDQLIELMKNTQK